MLTRSFIHHYVKSSTAKKKFQNCTVTRFKHCFRVPVMYIYEVFLSQVEKESFKLPFENLRHSNTSKEEWEATRTLADDRTIFIKKANKGSCVVAWDGMDYLLEAEKQLNDISTYKSIEFKKNF